MQIKQGQRYNSSLEPPKCGMNQTSRQISLIHFLFTTTFLSNIVTALKKFEAKQCFNSHLSFCPQREGVPVRGLPDRGPLDRDTPPPPRTETLLHKEPAGQRAPLDRDPPYGKEWAVHILLECILVFY